MRTALAGSSGHGGRREVSRNGGDFFTPEEEKIWRTIVTRGNTSGHLGASVLASTAGGNRRVSWGDEATVAIDIGSIASKRTANSRAATADGTHDIGLGSRLSNSPWLNYASWQQGLTRARAEGVLPPTIEEPEEFILPPEGYRAPGRDEFHDTAPMDDAAMERVLRGLHNL